jgi:DNA mismatch endonuclease, patch repair protein
MRANRSRDTSPERTLRSALHVLGFRYRVASRPLPDLRRTADLVFRSARVAVFVDGCYWHGCPEHYTEPTTNAEYWRSKIGRNKARDVDTDRRLRMAGWTPLRIWEHEPLDHAVGQVVVALRGARPQ